MANILTSLRIICGLLILVFPAFSKWYYLFYIFGGFTDAIDGTVARKLGTESEFGSKLDTAADMVFVLAVVIKIVCFVAVPLWLLVWIGMIAFIKGVNIVAGFVRYHRFVTVHSMLNKLCGMIVFIPPLFIGGDSAWQAKALVIIFACMVASVAAIQEFVSIRSGKQLGNKFLILCCV